MTDEVHLGCLDNASSFPRRGATDSLSQGRQGDRGDLDVLAVRLALENDVGWLALEKGMDVARAWKPDLILMDLQLPGVGGISF